MWVVSLTIAEGFPATEVGSAHSETGRGETLECFPPFPQQPPQEESFELGRGRVAPVLRRRSADTLDPFSGLRAGAEPAVQPTPAVGHRGAPTRRASPSLGSAPRCLREVAWRVPVPKPPSSLLIGYSFGFRNHPPFPIAPGECRCSRRERRVALELQRHHPRWASIEQLISGWIPQRPLTAVCGNLPPPGVHLGERSHVDLTSPRFVRGVGQPATIGGECGPSLGPIVVQQDR